MHNFTSLGQVEDIAIPLKKKMAEKQGANLEATVQLFELKMNTS